MILIDTNVLLDVLQVDPVWADWSQTQLDAASLQDQIAINPVVYAELSVSFRRREELEDALQDFDISIEDIPHEALFLAGKALAAYRRRGGTKSGVLSDFFIGAHAAILGCPLVTRDTRHHLEYFPGLKLVAPQRT